MAFGESWRARLVGRVVNVHTMTGKTGLAVRLLEVVRGHVAQIIHIIHRAGAIVDVGS